MSKTTTHILIYNDQLPLYRLIIGQLQKYGLLFSVQVDKSENWKDVGLPFVNYSRMYRELIMLDKNSGNTNYGLKAIIQILKNANYRLLSKILEYAPIYYAFSFLLKSSAQFYFIFNTEKFNNRCRKNNRIWELIFIIISGILISSILSHFMNTHLNEYVKKPAYWNSEFLMFPAQLLFQAIFLLISKERRIVRYLAQVSMVSLLGAIMLLLFEIPFFILGLADVSLVFIKPFAFGLVVGWMFMEHKNRVKALNLPLLLCYTWVLFRMLIYPLIFKI